jgi:Ca2+-binding EF-hand superfamily protein
MSRIFRVMDDNNSGTLDIQEFWKALCDFRIAVSPEECRKLFDKFDLNDDGDLVYDELINALTLPLSPIRRDLVMKVFRKLDRDESGVVDMRDIAPVYNAKQHPDVKSGKRTEQEILSEFLDTFELHHALLSGDQSTRDGSVTKDEFLEYYRTVGGSIQDDQYFELMITNAWNLNDKHYSSGWAAK